VLIRGETEKHTNYREHKARYTLYSGPEADSETNTQTYMFKDGNIRQKCCKEDGMVIARLGGVTRDS